MQFTWIPTIYEFQVMSSFRHDLQKLTMKPTAKMKYGKKMPQTKIRRENMNKIKTNRKNYGKKNEKKSQRMKRCAKEWDGKQNFIKFTEMNAINSNWILFSVRKRIKYFVGLKQNYKRTIQFLDLLKSILHSMQTKCNNCMGNNTNMSFKIQFFFSFFNLVWSLYIVYVMVSFWNYLNWSGQQNCHTVCELNWLLVRWFLEHTTLE